MKLEELKMLLHMFISKWENEVGEFKRCGLGLSAGGVSMGVDPMDTRKTG